MVDLDELKSSANIAELLSAEERAKIASSVIKGYDLDETSRAEWLDLVNKALEIAKQTVEAKNFPFENSANVKYPLITKGAIDYAARTYPELVQNNQVVKPAVVGNDPENQKYKKAQRVCAYMSYQLLHESTCWEDELDTLLHVFPIVGTVFKKTYYNPILKRPVSELCPPDKIIVNYNITSLEEARRITHRISLSTNDIVERIRSGLFRDVDVEELVSSENSNDDIDPQIELLEQHCYLDLDEDGYKEPYIVIVHKPSGELLRVVNRFKEIHRNDKKEVVRINPIHFFTDFHFIRSADGGFYSMGLGTLLYHFNAAINTIVNQLLDAGTLNNSQGGFIGRGLRLKNTDLTLGLGEWKVVDTASGANLAQNIVPLPTKEPSPTLFELLRMLVEAGRDLISNTDILQGKGHTQNVAATTVLALAQQGMTVHNSITKRLYRALDKEFKKIFELNKKHLNNSEYVRVLDDPEANVKADFDIDARDLIPVANPNMASAVQRVNAAQAVMALPTVDAREASIQYLEALQIERSRIEKLMPEPDPNAPPPPDVQKTLAEIKKLQADAQSLMVEAQIASEAQMLESMRLEVQKMEAQVRADESAARIFKMKQDAIQNAAKVELAGAKADAQTRLAEFDQLHKKEKDEIELSLDTVKTMGELHIKANEKSDDNN